MFLDQQQSSMFFEDISPSMNEIVDGIIGTGRWQFLITLLLSLCTLNHMLNTGTEALMRPGGWWCKKPSYLLHWTDGEWILYSHSSESCIGICNRKLWDKQFLADGYFQGCTIFDIDYRIAANWNFSQTPPISTNKTIPCPNGIHYNNIGGQNLAEKYNVGCDNGRIVSSLWQSSSTFGRIIGYIFMGKMSDLIGRKNVLFISCGLAPLTAIFVALSTHYIVFILTSIINGISQGAFPICLILIIECSTNVTRSGLLIIGCCSFGIGIGLLPAINNLFKSYDLMLITLNILFLLIFPFTKIIPESPAWLFCTQNLDKLKKIIRQGAKMNGKSIPQGFRIIYSENPRLQLPKKRTQLYDILREPEIACEIIGMSYLTGLFALIFGSSYYTILAYVTQSQIASPLLAIATISGMLCGQFCILLMGHKKILQISILLVLISSFMLIIDLHDLRPSNIGPVTILLLVNVSIVSLSYGVLINYNVRTVPTLVRGTLSGIWRAIWELFVWIGNHDYVTFPKSAFILIVTCILAGLFSFNLNDLYHRELPDTINDSIDFKIKSKARRWIIEENEKFIDEMKSNNKLGTLKKFRKNSIQPGPAE